MMGLLIFYLSLGWILWPTTADLPPYRLDGRVVPSHYDLEISVVLEEDGPPRSDLYTFWGTVRIEIKCKEDTDHIFLHSSNLTIDEDNVTLTEKDVCKPKEIKLVTLSYNTKYEFFVVQTKSKLQAGKNYSFSIPFSSRLNGEDFKGFYRSYYRNSQNALKSLAVTQFEPTSARAAFPCFDEPKMKATFTIAISHHKYYTAVSNMPLEETAPVPNRPGWVRDRFAKSIRMSTYLVAFVVSNFTNETAVSQGGVKFRVWADPSQMGNIQFAKECGPKALDLYESWFDIQYPLWKVDVMAIPQFEAGGMENWGLLLFKSGAVPVANIPLVNQSYLAGVIPHELAHQWFGNLVTMEWWTDLWLNEGFASYFEILTTDQIYPELNFAESSFGDEIRKVYERAPGPVLAPTANPTEIEGLFDDHRYSKGMLILRMMTHLLGEEVFLDGLNHYLNRHQYGNVRQDDFWKVMDEIARKKGAIEPEISIKTIMDTWTTQTGFAVLHVQNNTEGIITVSQHIHEVKPNRIRRATGNRLTYWWIPITYTTEEIADFSMTKPKQWLTGCETLEIPDLNGKDDQWIIFNLQVTAFYRVNYYEENWNLLKKALENDASRMKIHPINRQQITDDALALGWSRELDYAFVFSLCAYVRKETNYLPLTAVYSGLRNIDFILRRTPHYGYFKSYIQKLITPTLKRSGFLMNSVRGPQAIEKKTLITKVASFYGIGDYVAEALRLFAKWYNHETPHAVSPIPRELLGQVCCTAMKNGREMEWDFLWEMYLDPNTKFDKTTMLTALACSRKVWIIERYLQYSINDTFIIRSQGLTVFESVADNIMGFAIARRFLERRVADIYAFHGAKNNKMGRYIEILAHQMSSKEDYEEVKAFTDKYDEYFKFSRSAVSRALDQIDTNIRWHAAHYAKIPEYLAPSLNML